MAFPPEVYLIGAQKSGTTTLAYLLAQHPDICLSEPKETHFFHNTGQKELIGIKNNFPITKLQFALMPRQLIQWHH